MRSTPRRSIRRKRKANRFSLFIVFIFALVLLIGAGFFVKGFIFGGEENNVVEPPGQTEPDNSNDDPQNEEPEPEPEPEETFTEIRIAAAGDIMFHSPQIKSAYNAATGTYDFRSMFEDVKPILSAADLTIANFETTTAGPSREYTGYPLFNTPDEAVDAIKDAGVDVLTTVNNHSLDTRDDGLKRTVKVIQERGIDTVGTYAEVPDSRVLLKEVEGIKIAILAYTESTNGLGDQYPPEQLNGMLNLMTKENISRDIQDAKNLDVDFIITFMHWGEEYMVEPNATQVDFAQFMAEEGVDLILGSHPHVIQKTDMIEANGQETFVVYSMGNFISNQRKETLGDNFEITEDGLIVNIDIRKNDLTGETVITDVEYVPTWVYRNMHSGDSTFTYRILPIDNFLLSDEISDAYKARMERSFESTISKMYEGVIGKE